jgi:hypothetical protein
VEREVAVLAEVEEGEAVARDKKSATNHVFDKSIK